MLAWVKTAPTMFNEDCTVRGNDDGMIGKCVNGEFSTKRNTAPKNEIDMFHYKAKDGSSRISYRRELSFLNKKENA